MKKNKLVFALLTVLTGVQAAGSDKILLKAVNESNDHGGNQGCRFTTLKKVIRGDLDDDGLDEAVVVYTSSADACGGGGTWHHDNIAWLEQRKDGWRVGYSIVPNTPSETLFDVVVHDIKWEDDTLHVVAGDGKPVGSPPSARLRYRYDYNMFIPVK